MTLKISTDRVTNIQSQVPIVNTPHRSADKGSTTGTTNRTKSNVRLIELNRPQAKSITRLGSIEFRNQTQSNSHKKIGPIERIRLNSIEFDWVRLNTI